MVLFNISFDVNGDVDEKQTIVAARKAGANEFIKDLSDGYDTDRGS